MAIASFSPAAGGYVLSAGPVSSNGTIPSGGSILAVTNTGEAVAFVNLGTASTLAAVFGSGLAIVPSETQYLTVGSDSTIAAITAFRQVGLNIVSGN